MSVPAVALDAVECTFPVTGATDESYTAIRDVTLSVADGEFLSIVGPTGCGKSTILNIVAGLLAPTAGDVRVFGKPLSGLNSAAGYLFQADAIMPWRTALQNVVAGLEIRGVAEKERYASAGTGCGALVSPARRMPIRISCPAACGDALRWRRC